MNSWVSVKMFAVGERTGLRLSWIKTQKELVQIGQSGLFDLYCSVFAEPPYFEKFTPQDVKDYFEQILQKQGIIFTAQSLRAGYERTVLRTSVDRRVFYTFDLGRVDIQHIL